jgi:hypothetical protein
MFSFLKLNCSRNILPGAMPQLKQLVASHRGSPGSIPGQIMWDLWWTKWQLFSEYFGFPCQSTFHQLLHNHHLSSRAGTIGQQWMMYQADSVSPPPEKLKKKKKKKHTSCRFYQDVQVTAHRNLDCTYQVQTIWHTLWISFTAKCGIVKPFSQPGYLVGSWWRTPLRHPPKINIDQ